MHKYKLLIVTVLAFVLGFALGASAVASAVASAYMSPNNLAAPKVKVFCEAGEANVKFEVTRESSYNWFSFDRIFSSGKTSHSQTPETLSYITIHPVRPGIYTMVVRQVLDFEKDSFPADGRVMAFQVIAVPICGN